ncbi:MAG: tetratricopeptide repeat protein [Ignavibacteria bacterium]|nr:tetratricopeptide repeat protein [Ignavibacteria bacterium]
MKKLIYSFFTLSLLALLISSCGDKTSGLSEEELFNQAKQMSDSSSLLNDDNLRKEAISLYSEFLNNFPNSTKVTEVYNQIAGLYFGLKDYQKAIETYTELYDKYPDTREGKNALFMVAFTYDETLKDKDKAIAAYKKFLEKYPQDAEGEKLSESARVMIDKLESGDDIIKMIEESEKKAAENEKKEEKTEPKKEETKIQHPKEQRDAAPPPETQDNK